MSQQITVLRDGTSAVPRFQDIKRQKPPHANQKD